MTAHFEVSSVQSGGSTLLVVSARNNGAQASCRCGNVRAKLSRSAFWISVARASYGRVDRQWRGCAGELPAKGRTRCRLVRRTARRASK
jgi:hypothetical protein